MKNKELAGYLEYTNLKNSASRKEINNMIEDAVKYQFLGICILPCWIPYAKDRLVRLEIKNLN